MTAAYYSGWFTSDLRWAILVVICVVIVGGIFLMLIAGLAMSRGRNDSHKRKRPLGVGKLPQDDVVRMTRVPYDWREERVR